MHACIGEGNGNPVQYSCLENPRDGRAWWAAIYGVAQSPTWLKWLSSSSILLKPFFNFQSSKRILNLTFFCHSLLLWMIRMLEVLIPPFWNSFSPNVIFNIILSILFFYFMWRQIFLCKMLDVREVTCMALVLGGQIIRGLWTLSQKAMYLNEIVPFWTGPFICSHKNSISFW